MLELLGSEDAQDAYRRYFAAVFAAAAFDEFEFASATHAHLTEGSVRKVSVSMPEGLTEAVRKRVGPGGFSRYVTEAVARQFELDLLADLLAALEAEHGAVPEDLLAEAEAAWPDESEA
ncbi:hypothetical protein [Carbonactinospora thermoautotrophica]|uniref:hypothetical protein n=1 Tax=Carbonactinospora thermoautotrophica TaxID=1469144 RepID=UPI00226E762E|nr:hypothetical protein [Carbonactinospora thermoautotrophica]